MASKEKVKVIFEEISFKKTALKYRTSHFWFDAKINGKTIAGQALFTTPKEPVVLKGEQWFGIVELGAGDKIKVEMELRVMTPGLGSLSLGSVGPKKPLKYPVQQREYTNSNKYFILDWRVELMVGGKFGKHSPKAIASSREHRDSVLLATVSGVEKLARMEIHPVRPAPRWGLSAPKRPNFPKGTGKAWEKTKGTKVKPSSPINVFPNPAVIPILSSASKDTAARIECTYYRPAGLKFKRKDPRLKWEIVPKGRAEFLGDPHGREVLVYGKTQGEVELQVNFKGSKFAFYRALVAPIRKITCRVNILKGPKKYDHPRSKPADIVDHIKIANMLLRQIGLELVFDTNTTVYDTSGATPVAGHTGIFEISVARGVTRNVRIDYIDAGKLNYRRSRPSITAPRKPFIMNFAYIHSTKKNSDGTRNYGFAVDIPANLTYPSGPARDTGRPSSSWIKPSGVKPDGVATTKSMVLYPKEHRSGHPQLAGAVITNLCGNPRTNLGKLWYGSVIAHELGHVLNLRHRDRSNTSGHDGLKHPSQQNLMHWSNPPLKAQDLDILQAKAAWGSPLIRT